MHDNGFDDEIGYGKPPRWTRFRKGQSGNPNGRPRKKRASPDAVPSQSALDDVLRRELARTIRVKEGEETKEMSTIEVITRAQITLAAKGNALAQREILRAGRELEERDARRNEAAEVAVREAFDAIVQYRVKRAAVWAEAAKAGKEPEQPWPHPDDVLLFPATLTFRIRGPAHPRDLARSNYIRAVRDHALACSFRERRRQAYPEAACTVWDYWMACDVMMPKRWQVIPRFDEETGILQFMDRAELDRHIELCTRKNDLLKPLANLQPSNEVYADANAVLKPLLNQIGYRSLAQFERMAELGLMGSDRLILT